MAIFKALTFDGVNSLDYGIYITGEAVYNAPERAVEMVNIPGKNGALALDQGRFENIEVTYHAGCFADNQAEFADKVMKFRNALASRYTYKRLLDGYHPDEYRLGLYKSGLDVDAVRYGTAGEFNIVFDCKPQRFLTDGDRTISPTDWSDVQTESDELVTIDSDGSLAVKALEVSLSPIQDFNGYDAPWVGGAGKNKLDTSDMSTAEQSGVTFSRASDGTITVGGKANATVYRAIGSIKTVSGVQYIITGVPSGGANGKYRMTIVGYGYDCGSGYTFTGDGNSHGVSVDIYTGYPSSGTLTFKPMIRLAAETDQTYAPYSNICPISGRTEVVTQRTGKNLLPYPYTNNSGTTNGITYSTTADGRVTISGTATATTWVRLYGGFAADTSLKKPVPSWITADTDYVLSGGQSSGFYVQANIYSGTSSIGQWIDTGSGKSFSLTSEQISNADSFAVFIRVNSGQTVNATISPMIEEGSAKSSWTPYNGTTYTTSLGRTVYGGTLDIVNGVLTVDRGLKTLNGTEGNTWYFTNSSVMQIVYALPNLLPSVKTSGDYQQTALFNSFDTAYNYSQRAVGRAYVDNGYFNMVFAPNTFSTSADVKTWLASNNVQIVYELAKPQTYQLTPQQIDLLLGTNHLWSDGEITVTYGVHPYYNPTPFDAKPLIKVTGTGTLGIGEYILTITGTASQTLYIDCETMEIYTLEGTVPTGASSLVSINKNDFPVLEPGTNYISVGSGITAVTITPRWWRI